MYVFIFERRAERESLLDYSQVLPTIRVGPGLKHEFRTPRGSPTRVTGTQLDHCFPKFVLIGGWIGKGVET